MAMGLGGLGARGEVCKKAFVSLESTTGQSPPLLRVRGSGEGGCG